MTDHADAITRDDHAQSRGLADHDTRALLTYLLVLSPLVYSQDNDPYRAWEVGVVAILVMALGTSLPFQRRWTAEMIVLAAFGAVVSFQQFFIPQGDLWFGAKYAICMATVFAPMWMISSLEWKLSEFATTWDRAIRVVAVIAAVNFGASFFLGVGETHPGGLLGDRVFGYLGDSFTPVLIFLFLYFLFQRELVWSFAMLASLVATQGKAAAVMLVFGLGVYWFLKTKGVMRAVVVLLALLFVAMAGYTMVRAALSIKAIDYSVATRMINYERGIELSRVYPMFGVGINQSMKGAEESGRGLARLASIKAFDSGAVKIDNAFLRASAETGVVGLVVLIALCFVLIGRAYSSMRCVLDAPPSKVRALILASGVWVVSFILTYQAVGWFEAGHPQMTWLLLIAAMGQAASRVYRRATVPRRSLPHTVPEQIASG